MDNDMNAIYEKEEDDKKEESSNEKDDKKDDLKNKIIKIISDAVKNYAADKAGDLLDELFMGNFKDAVIDVYKSKKANSMSEEDLNTAMEDLKAEPKYKHGKDYAELDNRKDDNTSSDVQFDSIKIWAMWHSKDKEVDIGKTINDIVSEFQKSTVETEKQKKELASKLKSMKIDISDEEFNQFGPMLQKVVEEGKPEEVKKKVEELRKQIKESYSKHFSKYLNAQLLEENTVILTEDEKHMILFDSLLESQEYRDCIVQQLINEGLLDKLKGAAKALGNKMKDLSGKAIQSLTKGAMMPILSLAGLATSIYTGGWAAAGILKLMYIIEKQGKKLRNGFERAYTQYANSKGAIAKMDFNIEGNKNLTYSMRFYEKDMVWRVLNTSDQLKKQGKDFAKSIVDGEYGKKFRDALKKTWDPLFSASKGGKIDFKAILSQAKNVDIPEKYIDLYSKFAENYEQIESNCINSPKIDTRTQSLKK